MGASKVYKQDNAYYEKKLARVMERFGVDRYTFDYMRHGAYVQFTYKGQVYRFEHDVDKAQAHGQNLNYGSDCFAQIILSLEELARMAQRGIYELQTWLEGMRALPPASTDVPDCFKLLGFVSMPASAEVVRARYKQLAKAAHPDTGGTHEHFVSLKHARDEALGYFGEEATAG